MIKATISLRACLAGYCDICNDRKLRSLNNINLDVEVNATVGNLAFWLVQETLSDY